MLLLLLFLLSGGGFNSFSRVRPTTRAVSAGELDVEVSSSKGFGLNIKHYCSVERAHDKATTHESRKLYKADPFPDPSSMRIN